QSLCIITRQPPTSTLFPYTTLFRSLDIECIGEQDLKDARFGIEHGVDWIAVSFVRTPADLQPIRDLIRSMGAPARLIAKIEKHRSEEHTSELQSPDHIVCRLMLEIK